MICQFRKLIPLTMATLIGVAFAQSSLPSCQGNDSSKWNNCFGKWSYSNGDTFVGEYKDGKRHGHGTYTFAEGSKYTGEHKDGNFEGRGTITYSGGGRYVGEVKDNKRNGQGTFFSADGFIGLGEWKDNLPDGRFIEYRADKSIDSSGVFKNGQLIKAESINPSIFNRISPEKINAPANPTVSSPQSLTPANPTVSSPPSLKERLEEQKKAENLENQRKQDEKKLDEINAAKNSIPKDYLIQKGYQLSCKGKASDFSSAVDFKNDMTVTSNIYKYAIVDDRLFDIRACSRQNPDKYCAKKSGSLFRTGNLLQFSNSTKLEWEYDLTTNKLVYDLNGNLLEFSCNRVAYKD
jgi:hypothetical protein